jgi:hypothetical protein
VNDPFDAYAEATRVQPARQARLLAHLDRPPVRRRLPTVLPVAFAVAALAFVGVPLWPRPPILVARRLEATGEATLGDAVRVTWDGTGEVAGDARDMRLAWEAGDVGVEVTPDAGVHLAITTGEVQIRVVGTGFDVRRDALGTTVAVRHGRVSVVCADAAETFLDAGETAECLPVTPPALLGRARAQKRRGDAPDAVLATLARIPSDTTGPAAAETALLRATELTRAGRTPEALTVAEAALEAGDSGRRIDLLRLAARLALALGGCERAAPHVAALAAAGEPTPCTPEPR